MKPRYVRTPLFVALLFALIVPSDAGALSVPTLSGRVVDQADILSSGARNEISAYLAAVEDASGVQIAVLTIPSLGGENLEEYSIRVTDEWQLGAADRDNGALLLVALQEKKIRIETGYGLEGVLTDAKSGIIIRDILQPRFRAGDFDGGIAGAIQAMGEIATGRSDIAVPASGATRSTGTTTRSGSSSVGIPFNFIVFLIILGLGSFGRRRRYGSFGRALFWGTMLGSSSRRSSYRSGGFGGSSFGGGGFGGGGFSGGGGGFGGGGASGGW